MQPKEETDKAHGIGEKRGREGNVEPSKASKKEDKRSWSPSAGMQQESTGEESHLPISGAGRSVDYKSLSANMKKHFDEGEYAKLVKKCVWEEEFRDMRPDSIAADLLGMELFPAPVSAKAKAIAEHLNPPSEAVQLCNAVNASDNKQAIDVLEQIANTHNYQDRDDHYVRPHQFSHSWAKTEWHMKLLEGRAVLEGLGKTPAANKRVMGIWTGTGNGKSHRLMELQDFDPRQQLKVYEAEGSNQPLDEEERKRVDVPAVDHFVYITYNLQQILGFDRAHAELAIYLRIMLRDLGLTNNGCDKFLRTHAEALRGLDEEKLCKFCVEYFAAKKSEHLGVAVDELRMLLHEGSVDRTHPSIRHTMTRLGNLAAALEKAGITCTAIVSSLTEDTFKSHSGRPMLVVTPPKLGPESIKFIIKHGLSDKKRTAQNIAMVLAVSGSHFRSAVQAVEIVKKGQEITPLQLFESLKAAIETKLDATERRYIREHVISMMKTGDGIKDHGQEFVDVNGAVAPSFTLMAFGQHDCEPNKHPAERMFEVSAFLSAPKQLERCGMYHDMLRALYGLPVVPHRIDVNKDGGSPFFNNLRFHRKVATHDDPRSESIFETKDRIVRLVPRWSPPDDQYMLPSASNHPLIDRACVAFSPDGAKCLVIYQDKINARGFSEAVAALNEAANLLKQHLSYPVLCVAHVVQASADTRAQDKFEHPFVLVREAEIEKYYTPTFAIPIRYVRARHNLENK